MRRWVAVILPLCAVGVVTFDAWLFSCGFNGCPSAAAIRGYRPPEGGRVLDRNGKLIGRLSVVKRVNVPLTRIPRHVRRAFIATEDRRFLSHDGVDWRGVARAVVRNVQSLGVREGFSTISMQAARLGFLSEREALRRSMGRKFIELRIARLLEQNLSKDEILELYLNSLHLGNGSYGVEAASRDLFDKHVWELSLGESAMLAAMAKAPSNYSPRRDYDRAVARRSVVLRLMADQGYIDESDAEEASDESIDINEDGWRPPQPNASYALDAIRAAVDTILRGQSAGAGDLVVYTTLDLTAQRAAERAVRAHAQRIESTVGYWNSSEPVQGAMVALDPRSGDIRALVGGREYERGTFNRAIAARRQPGSAFKPFVYAAALAAGLTPATVVDDEPVTVQVGNTMWEPANYGGEYRGPLTLRRALAVSANAATVRVSRTVGERSVVDVAKRNGIRSPLSAVPSIALGAVEVTPLELVTAYAPFANGGDRVQPRLIRKIERSDKSVAWSSSPARERVMDERDAFQLTSMLRSVVDEGTGRVVRGMGVTGPVAGKTGTSNDGTDVWFVGYTPTIIAGFWFGYDTPASLGSEANGGRFAAPAWADFYQAGWSERAPAWRAPKGLVSVNIDAESGLLADDWCGGDSRREWFKVGTQPSQRCNNRYHLPSDAIDEVIAQLDAERLRPLAKALRGLIDR